MKNANLVSAVIRKGGWLTHNNLVTMVTIDNIPGSHHSRLFTCKYKRSIIQFIFSVLDLVIIKYRECKENELYWIENNSVTVYSERLEYPLSGKVWYLATYYIQYIEITTQENTVQSA